MIYVLSDIHGNIERFNSIMEQIKLQPEDTLYVLGDVIDRFPNGIKILRRLMKMPNVQMLLGNHEYMMLNALAGFDADNRERERMLYLWYNNGGDVTHNSLKRIKKVTRQEIFDYLRALPTNIKIEVNGKKYLFVHGSPIENFRKIRHMHDDEIEFAVWNRWRPLDPVPEGYTMIFGHTPTEHFQTVNPLSIWYEEHGRAIGIDCGCAFQPTPYAPNGRLACIRLDDMKVFYSKDVKTDNE